MLAKRVARSNRGSTTTEQVLLFSVVIIALIGISEGLLAAFGIGINFLAKDVFIVLVDGDSTNGGGGGGGNGGGSGGGGGYDGGGWNDGDGGAPDSSDPDAGDDDEGAQDDEGEGDDNAEECPYVYDEASGRWRDPETGQYVSNDDASSAGC